MIAFVPLIDIPSSLAVHFRGTSGFAQLVFESGQTLFKPLVNASIGGHVSSYFAQVFDLLWTSGLKDDYVMMKTKYPQYKIWVRFPIGGWSS